MNENQCKYRETMEGVRGVSFEQSRSDSLLEAVGLTSLSPSGLDFLTAFQ